jgi:acrylyl-CoA reductase (NADPH)
MKYRFDRVCGISCGSDKSMGILMFKGIVVDRTDSSYEASLVDCDDARLPHGDVHVEIAYSTINYKDALAITVALPCYAAFP